MAVRTRLTFPRVFAVAALALLSLPSLEAQDAAHWQTVLTTTIKPDSRDAYEGFMKEVSAAFKKAGRQRFVAEAIAGDRSEYVSVSPLPNFADLDGPTVIEKALGKEGAAKLLKKGAPMITGSHRIYERVQNDLSIQTEGDPGQFVTVTFVHLVNGKATAYNDWLKSEYIPALKKAGVKSFAAGQPVFGSDPNQRIEVSWMSKMAEIDKGPKLNQGVGAEKAAEILSHAVGLVRYRERMIYKFRPDLSNLAEPAK